MSGRPVHTFEVVRTEQVSPHMVRVVLGGNGFDTFEPSEFTDAYCKLLFLREDVDVTTLSTLLTWSSFDALPDDAVARVFVEVAGPDDEIAVRVPEGVDVK